MLKEIQAQPEKLFEIIRVDIRALLNGSLRSLISPGLIKRRIKSTEIVACENACYTLRAFFCLKMELHWRSNPFEVCVRTCHSSKNWLMAIPQKKLTVPC